MTKKATMFRQNRKRAFAGKIKAALGVLAALSVAQGVSPAWAGDGDGGTQSVFSLGAGSRGISLGRAYSTLADDATAIYWNPATLRNVQTKQLSFMYMPLYGDFTDATYMTFALVYPTLNAGSFGLGFMRVSSTFDRYDEFSRPLGEGDYSESQFMIGYAFERSSKWIAGRLATGASFKIVSQKVDPFSSTAPGVDLGFRYLPDFAKSLSLAVNLQDLVGADHKLDAESDRTARTIMMGAGYTVPFSNGSALRLMLQYDLPEFADGKFRAGAEYAFSKYVALRVGMDDSDFSFGLGVTASAFGLDYAMLSRDTAGSSHPVTFTASYGSTLDEQRMAAAAQRDREDSVTVQRAYNARIKDHRDRAVSYEAQGNLAGAVDEWKIVLDFSPGDPDATARLDAVTARLVEEQERSARDMRKQGEISAHFAEGLRLYQENDYAGSRAEWRAILAIDSTHAEAKDYLDRTQVEIDKKIRQHAAQASRFEQSKRFTEAISEWNNVQSLDPGNRQAKAAVERIRKTIEVQSQDLEQASKRLDIVNLYDTALQAYNQGEYEKAISDLDRLLALEPGHEEARNLRTMAVRKNTPLTPQQEDEIRRLFLRGMQHFAKEEYQKAIDEWQKILAIDPTNESVRRNIEEAKERLKKIEERG